MDGQITVGRTESLHFTVQWCQLRWVGLRVPFRNLYKLTSRSRAKGKRMALEVCFLAPLLGCSQLSLNPAAGTSDISGLHGHRIHMHRSTLRHGIKIKS